VQIFFEIRVQGVSLFSGGGATKTNKKWRLVRKGGVNIHPQEHHSSAPGLVVVAERVGEGDEAHNGGE